MIGQETQGPGGFFMALRAIHVIKGVLDDMEQVCPKAMLFNYTNPVNIVAQAVTQHSDIPFISLCEGPIYFRDRPRSRPGSDPRLDTWMIGLNHACWSVRHRYDGADAMPLIAEAWKRREDDPTLTDKYRLPAGIAADGLGPLRLLPVLLLRRRGARRARGEADDAGRGHHGVGARLLVPLRRAGDERRPDP